MSSASAPTLFMSAESAEPSPDMTRMWDIRVLAAPLTLRARKSTAPELDSPRLMISTMAMTTVAG